MADQARTSRPHRSYTPDLHPVPAPAARKAQAAQRPLLRAMFGDHLRRTRLAQRRTLADVARAAKVSLPYLSEVERGRKEASSEVLAAICDALGISLADLLIDAGTSLVAWQLAAAPVLRLGRAGTGLAGPAVPARPGTAQASCRLAA